MQSEPEQRYSATEFARLCSSDESRTLVTLERNGKTYALDLSGFIHPGPLLTDGKLFASGDDVTELFNSKPFHDGKNPLSACNVIGTITNSERKPAAPKEQSSPNAE